MLGMVVGHLHWALASSCGVPRQANFCLHGTSGKKTNLCNRAACACISTWCDYETRQVFRHFAACRMSSSTTAAGAASGPLSSPKPKKITIKFSKASMDAAEAARRIKAELESKVATAVKAALEGEFAHELLAALEEALGASEGEELSKENLLEAVKHRGVGYRVSAVEGMRDLLGKFIAAVALGVTPNTAKSGGGADATKIDEDGDTMTFEVKTVRRRRDLRDYASFQLGHSLTDKEEPDYGVFIVLPTDRSEGPLTAFLEESKVFKLSWGVVKSYAGKTALQVNWSKKERPPGLERITIAA